MLQSVKLQKRQSEIRQSLAELANKDEITEDEQRSIDKLDKEYQATEAKYRAALISEDETRKEAGEELETRSEKEWSDMMDRFEVRQVAMALDTGEKLTGATKEIIEELRSHGSYQGLPLPLAALEQRAGETVSGDLFSPKATRNIIGRIFPNSVASKLGVQSVNIPQGTAEWPVATAGAVTGWQADELSDVGAATAYQTTEATVSPDNTLGAQMVLTRKSLKQTGQGLENAVRQDMSAAIAVALDDAIINGSGAAGQPLGIVPGAATYGITSTDMAAVAPDWAAFRAEVISFMEANAITDPSQVKLAFPPAIWGEMDDALISGTAVSELDRMTKHGVSPVLANQLTAGSAILTTTVNGVAPAFVGMWGAVDMIRDPYTRAASGQLVLTGLVTADVTVARGLQTRILTNFA
ncbi:phage major capsid protein [Qingshengfaniella alkalisoli]|uniref:Phage major capsid protein n=1 Tax=Qingshengfaniella alkalisoli TaxID=2599296 RepID=A0A5B8I708_9RHOB|nr:phage major capsid protein [Qingshengfaniella alkalisoli]QDY69319.1 phage major capsid protein [Qingshengfaniella alkalisoli]